MTKGIYFLDKNTGLLSDLESFFIMNEIVRFCGGCGLLQQAKKELSEKSGIEFIVITDNLIDSTCVEALKELMAHPAKKIVALRSNDELLKEKISKHAVVIPYPFSCNLLEETIKRSSDAPGYNEADLERIADSNLDTDNPFFTSEHQPKKVYTETPSFRERIKNVQLNRYKEPNTRVLPQKVIAIHSQKGGVGKSTISRELAISISCIQIRNDVVAYKPKVCLCDFDFEASDIASIMGLENSNSIMTWCEDIEYEKERSRVRAEDVRFTEDVVKERYLTEHESGVYVLCGPVRKTDCFKIDSSYIEAIIENLKLCDFDFIIMDTGPNILDYTLTSLSLADEIFAVCNCDMLSAGRIDGMINDIFEYIPNFNLGKIKLLVNKMQERPKLTPQEISKTLNLTLIGEIPFYPEIVDINNEGVSVFFNRRKPSGKANEYAASFKAISKLLVKENSFRNESKRAETFAVEGLDNDNRTPLRGLFRK